MYPRSKQAKSVQEALLQEIQRLSVTLVMEKQVKRIEMTDPGFLVTTADKETFTAGSVILACGGKASAIRGSRGDGYYLASCLGHEIAEPVPALVQLHAASFGKKWLRVFGQMPGSRPGSTIRRPLSGRENYDH